MEVAHLFIFMAQRLPYWNSYLKNKSGYELGTKGSCTFSNLWTFWNLNFSYLQVLPQQIFVAYEVELDL